MNANVGSFSPYSVIVTTRASSGRSTSLRMTWIPSFFANRRSFSNADIALPSTPTTLWKSSTMNSNPRPASSTSRSCRARISSRSLYDVAKKRNPCNLAQYANVPDSTIAFTSARVRA
eukprot:29004-Pelagococcus_subviridis.AAC.3